MNNQPSHYEPILHFDLYSVKWIKDGWHVTQMFKNLSWLSAEMLSGAEHLDFCASLERTGWLGTCPEWHGFKPVVTVPRGEQLDIDHIDFILEQM
jgi:hypothetical protein